MALPPMVLGTRYAVRVGASAPGTGHAARDLVGTLVAADATTWTLLPDDRGAETIPVTSVQAARSVPPRAVRPTSSVDDLERLTWQDWPGTEQHRVGGWVLRVGRGCTLRANSALAVGEPGRSLGEAVDLVEGIYRRRGLTPRVLAPQDRHGAPHPVDAVLDSRGYTTSGAARVMVSDLRTHAGAPGAGLEVAWGDDPADAWWQVLGGDRDRQDGYAEELAARPARYVVLWSGGTPVARARVTITQDWASVTALVVDRSRRRQGLGRLAMAAVVAEARAQGARWGVLQVEAHNTAARQLYLQDGWRDHHGYHFRTAPAQD